MNGITFIRQNGGLGRRLAGSDHISGLIVAGIDNAPIVLNSVDDFTLDKVQFALAYYHVLEFFRISEGGKFYLMPVNDFDIVNIAQLQSFANGEIRQLGIISGKTLAEFVAEISQYQAAADDLATQNMPLSLVVQCSFNKADLATLPDLHTLSAARVSVVIGDDAGGLGNYYRTKYGSMGVIGACLGSIARAAVSQNIGWVARQNLVTTNYDKKMTGNATVAKELDIPAFLNGSKTVEPTKISELTNNQLKVISDKGYLFVRKHIGDAGSYFNDSFTCTELDDDFAYIENNRTIDKVQRVVYKALLPSVCAPVYANPDTGNITVDNAAALEEIAREPLDVMLGDGDLSGHEVSIDTNQPVLSTSHLEIVVTAVPVGVQRKMTVKLGFAVKVS